MSVHAPSRVHIAMPAAVQRHVATNVTRGLAVAGVLLCADVRLDLWYSQGFRDIPTIGLHEVASGQPQVLAEVAEYVAVVFGGLASWMLWRQSR